MPHCPLQTARSVLPVQDSGGLLSLHDTPPWDIYMFGYIDEENKTKQNKIKKMLTQHTHNTKWDCVPCFVFSITQIAVIISLA